MKRPGRRGWTAYADLLRVVQDNPGTTREVAQRYGMAIRSVREVLYVMRDAGLIFECAWRCSTNGERLQAVWSTQGPPAPRPTGLRSPAPVAHMPQLARFCQVVAVLMAGAWTPAEVADEANASLNRVRPLLRYLCTGQRMAYIERWRPTHGGWPVPVYRWGPNKPSAKSPTPRPESEAWRKQHQIRQQRVFWIHMIFLTAGAKPA